MAWDWNNTTQIDYATNNVNPNDGITINGGNATAGATQTIGFVGATTASGCQITYKSATSTASPQFTLVTTGC